MKMRHWFEISDAERIERWQMAWQTLKDLTPHEKRQHFNMATWGEKTECGTIACAAGHCGLNPWFRRRGFQLNFAKVNHPHVPGEFYWDASISSVPDFFGPRGTSGIFHNSRQRPVSEVMREIKDYIKDLKFFSTERAEAA